MNQWGRRFRLSIFGESHGLGVGITMDGVPAGIPFDGERLQRHLDRRRPGQSTLTTQRNEADQAKILTGVYDGHTTGAPLTVWIDNQDQRSRDYGDLDHVMRPGHSDYPAHVKYAGNNDFRGGGHFSGRLTAPLVAAGAVAMMILDDHDITVAAHLHQVGEHEGPGRRLSAAAINAAVQESQVFTAHAELESTFVERVESARRAKDSVGGIVAAHADGVPVGLGDPFFDSIESTLGHLYFSIPAVKGVDFGSGFDAVSMAGSQHNDAYQLDDHGNIRTATNHAGGILGGITDGAPLRARVAIKPASSIFQPQDTVDLDGPKATTITLKGRHDPCIAIRAVPVVRAATAIGLADALLLARQEGLL